MTRSPRLSAFGIVLATVCMSAPVLANHDAARDARPATAVASGFRPARNGVRSRFFNRVQSRRFFHAGTGQRAEVRVRRGVFRTSVRTTVTNSAGEVIASDRFRVSNLRRVDRGGRRVNMAKAYAARQIGALGGTAKRVAFEDHDSARIESLRAKQATRGMRVDRGFAVGLAAVTLGATGFAAVAGGPLAVIGVLAGTSVFARSAFSAAVSTKDIRAVRADVVEETYAENLDGALFTNKSFPGK